MSIPDEHGHIEDKKTAGLTDKRADTWDISIGTKDVHKTSVNCGIEEINGRDHALDIHRFGLGEIAPFG